MNQALENRIEEMKEEIIQAILQSVAIESVKGEAAEGAPYGVGPKAALLDAIAQSEKLGLKAVNVDNKIGYAEIGEGDEMVAILGHLDVVPLGDGWTKNPLGEIVGDKVYGRGVTDNKGPTIASLYILKAIKELGIKINRRIRVIFGTDEESGFDCVYHYTKSGQELPVAGFTPDADYPAVFAEKGRLGYTFSKNIAQNPDFKLIELSGGVAENVVTQQVKMVYQSKSNILENSVALGDDQHRITVDGKPAHASTPHLGENAFMLLCKELAQHNLSGDLFDVAKFVNEKFNFETNGKTMGVNFSDEESGEITLSIGMVAFEEGKVSFTLDIRYPVTMDAQPCIDMIQNAAAEYGIEAQLTSHAKPHYVPKDSPLIRNLMAVYREKTGDDSEAVALGGGTYAKAFKNIVAFGVEFPGQSLPIHQADEYNTIDGIIRSTQISAEAIVRLANEKY